MATVVNEDHAPYVTGSDHPLLLQVLQDEWPRSVIPSALPH